MLSPTWMVRVLGAKAKPTILAAYCVATAVDARATTSATAATDATTERPFLEIILTPPRDPRTAEATLFRPARIGRRNLVHDKVAGRAVAPRVRAVRVRARSEAPGPS